MNTPHGLSEVATDWPDTGLELDLDDAGRARTPALVVDAASWPELSSDGLARATAVLEHCDAVVIALAGDTELPEALGASADIVLGADEQLGSQVGGRTVVVPDPRAEADGLVDQITAMPTAALALSWLLRAGENLDVAGAVGAESAAYSALLAGPDFASWLAARGPSRPPGQPERINLNREGNELQLRLCRLDRRNAVDAAMREALLSALAIAQSNSEVTVRIDADGPSFSAGGDLDEFGTAPNPAAAHVIRTNRSVGRVLHELRDRVTVHVHGDCIGAGAELPAFAGQVIAVEQTRFRLPEIAMGLIPGAGGTVSIPRRVGRARALWFGLSGEVINAATALQWGLVDGLE